MAPNTAESNKLKKVFVKTWGCQMNVYDSTRMQDALESDGYTATGDIEDADLVLRPQLVGISSADFTARQRAIDAGRAAAQAALPALRQRLAASAL